MHMAIARDIHWHHSQVKRTDRQLLHGHRGVVLWLTGLSGEGKSTWAHVVRAQLHKLGSLPMCLMVTMCGMVCVLTLGFRWRIGSRISGALARSRACLSIWAPLF